MTVVELRDALVQRALTPATEPAERDRAVAELLAVAGRRREPLEAARAVLQRRLYDRRDDADATRALGLVERAVAQAPR